MATRRSNLAHDSQGLIRFSNLNLVPVMVRIKHRYLLVHILYPDPADPPKGKIPSKSPEKALPDLVQFHRPSPNDLTPQLLARTIRDQVLLLYGDYGLGLVSSSLNVKYLSPATSTAIVRCSRAHYRLVWAALSFMTQLTKTSKQGQPRACAIQVVRVSGTIKKAEEEAIRRARAAILRAKRESGESSTDGLLGILGKDDEGVLQGEKNMTAGSDVSDEDDEMGMGSDGES
ncbi:hypothetical protein HO173_005637 [Letharia columbiana]|uniref:Ribonuclease P/MRP protein subunit POP5 n=1 Tax=Letharia columbiana TaxID=112416 RepID=A0A8H6FWG2_9LECA|nr:uncharacterized protein HO173_005637 [Letharia columbiana]KAF6236009.1 hypothetical protein HO173_005637 [Letharia columbiana]